MRRLRKLAIYIVMVLVMRGIVIHIAISKPRPESGELCVVIEHDQPLYFPSRDDHVCYTDDFCAIYGCKGRSLLLATKPLFACTLSCSTYTSSRCELFDCGQFSGPVAMI